MHLRTLACAIYIPFSDIPKDECEVDTLSSIHSYDGNVADLTTDELAYHELGETTEVSFQ